MIKRSQTFAEILFNDRNDPSMSVKSKNPIYQDPINSRHGRKRSVFEGRERERGVSYERKATIIFAFGEAAARKEEGIKRHCSGSARATR